MKYVKITIKKTRSNGGKETSFTYPEWHDPQKINIIHYQNEGKNIEHAIGIVADDFEFTDWYMELNRTAAENLLDEYIDTDKDTEEWKVISPNTTKSRAEIKQIRRMHLDG